MRLIKCHIFGFGTFCDEKIDFKEDLTAILEENGFGKSTLAAFIKAMLYGFETARKGDTPVTSDRLKYTPWNASSFGGSLTFECDKGVYTVTRNFAKASKTADSFEIINAKTGKVCDDFSSELGAELFGIDEKGFERSTFSGAKIELDALPSSLRHKIGGEMDKAEDIGDFEPAKKRIDEALKAIGEKSGEIFEAKKKISENKARIDKYKVELEEYVRLNIELEKAKAELIAEEETEKKLSALLKQADTYESNKGKLEKYNELVSQIKEKQAELESLEKKYGENIPEEEAVLSLRDKITEFSNKKLILEHQKNQLESLSHIEKSFKEKIPTDSEILSLDEEVSRIDAHNAVIAEKKRENLEKEEKLSEIGVKVNALPTIEEVEKAKNAVAAPPKSKNTAEKILITVSVLGLIAGAGLCFANLIAGIGCMVVFAVLLIVSIFYSLLQKKFASNSLVSDKKAQVEFLVKNGFSPDANFEQVCDKLVSAIKLKQEIEQNKKRIEEENAALKNALEKSWEFMDLFLERRETLRQTYDEFKNLYNRYQNELVPNSQRIKESRAELEKLSLEIISLFAGLGIEAKEERFEEKIAELENDLSAYSQILEQIREQNEKRQKIYEEDKIESITLPEQELKVEEILQEKDANQQKLGEIRDRYAYLSNQARRLAGAQEEINLLENENSDLEENLEEFYEKQELLKTTLEFLNSAKNELTRKYSAKVTSGFEKYSNLFFNGKNSEITLDENLEISVIKDGRARYPQNFSQGQQSVIDLCLRFALANAMFEKEAPFIILDDPFVNLDKDNLESALRLVKEACKDMQIIYLTCHNSRML